jgi:hypothetical protein
MSGARNLLFRGALFSRGGLVRCNCVRGIEQDRYPHRDELLVPAGQRAVAQQSTQESRDALRDSRRIRQDLEHVRHHASLDQQRVVKCGGIRRHRVALKQGNT